MSFKKILVLNLLTDRELELYNALNKFKLNSYLKIHCIFWYCKTLMFSLQNRKGLFNTLLISWKFMNLNIILIKYRDTSLGLILFIIIEKPGIERCLTSRHVKALKRVYARNWTQFTHRVTAVKHSVHSKA